MEMGMITMGPIGPSPGGNYNWDDKGNNVISHIIVNYDSNSVRSIQFGYVNNGALVLSKMYGSSSSSGYSSRIVRLKHESEFVTGISMEINSYSMTSLTFYTNLTKHEVVHLQFDSAQTVPTKMELHSGILERREFGGFFGTHTDYNLRSIGFYVRPLLPDVETD